jgi:hypothetical protein
VLPWGHTKSTVSGKKPAKPKQIVPYGVVFIDWRALQMRRAEVGSWIRQPPFRPCAFASRPSSPLPRGQLDDGRLGDATEALRRAP